MGCIGKKFVLIHVPQANSSLALIEMRMYIARLVSEFDLELESDKPLGYKFGLVHHTEPIHMRVSLRPRQK